MMRCRQVTYIVILNVIVGIQNIKDKVQAIIAVARFEEGKLNGLGVFGSSVIQDAVD